MNAGVAAKAYTANGNGRVIPMPKLSSLDNILIWIGAKEMANTTPTSPLEWNKTVVGLIGTLLASLSMLVAVTYWAATLAATLNSDISHVKESQLKREARITELERDTKALQVEIKVLQTRLDRLDK